MQVTIMITDAPCVEAPNGVAVAFKFDPTEAVREPMSPAGRFGATIMDLIESIHADLVLDGKQITLIKLGEQQFRCN